MITKVLEPKRPKTEVSYIISNDKVFEIDNYFTIGRHPSNNLVFFEDSFASQKHCRIEKRLDSYVIKDLRSKNGTFVNGALILEAPLKTNDEIRCGESSFIFKEDLEKSTGIPKEFYSSKNAKWRSELNKIQAFGSSEMPVLILGPSGTGKEFIAKALHFNSPRAYSELVSVNCSAFNAQLIESELFGHLEGSYTGATKNRKGAFQQAKGGTLLLDEIGDLPLDLQPKLLRALENNEIRPVGSDKATKIDVRIIASTHKNLLEKVRTGEFREDLYYRLQTLTLHPPALKERLEDFEGLLFQFSREHRIRFSPESIKLLKKYSWPGNIRELKNIVKRASVIYRGQGVQAKDISDLLDNHTSKADGFKIVSKPETSIVKELEKKLILETYEANNRNQRKTAYELGIPKSTLHDKIRSYLKT